jgi:hypothetical protein
VALGYRDDDPVAFARARELLDSGAISSQDTPVQVARLVAARREGDRRAEAETARRLAEAELLDAAERAQLFERAGYLLSTELSQDDEACACFEACLALRPESDFAFGWLVKRAEAKADHARLLELIELRRSALGAKNQEGAHTAELELLEFNRSSYLRSLGRPGAALASLESLTSSLHFGAEALSLQVDLNLELDRRSQAADCLVRLTRLEQLELEPRRAAATHAADLLERVGRNREALDLVHEALDLGVPESRLRMVQIRAATATGQYGEAFAALSRENDECDNITERLKSAELMLALQEQHLRDASLYADAARRVLRDNPLDMRAQDAVLSLGFSREERRLLLAPGLEDLLKRVDNDPLDGRLIRRFLAFAHAAGSPDVVTMALGLAELLGADASGPERERAVPRPSGSLGEVDFKLLGPRALLAGDWDALRVLSRAIAHYTEPTPEALGLSYLLRVEGPSEHELFADFSRWAEVFCVPNVELYVGGPDPGASYLLGRGDGICVMGSAVGAPLTRRQTAQLAIQMFALHEGILALISEPDDKLELWLGALFALTEDLRFGPEIATHKANLETALDPFDLALLKNASQSLKERGKSSSELLIALRVVALRVALLVTGEASILKSLRDELPEDFEAQRIALRQALEFVLSGEALRLHRKVFGT